jgi:hypothetical protein
VPAATITSARFSPPRVPVGLRIARMRAEGLGPREMADRLNGEGEPPPLRAASWTPLNVLYAARRMRRFQR